MYKFVNTDYNKLYRQLDHLKLNSIIDCILQIYTYFTYIVAE